MSEKSPNARKTSKSRLLFFGSATRRSDKPQKKNSGVENNVQDGNDIHFEKETLLDLELMKVDINKNQEKEDKRHKLSESLKNAGKNLLPHLRTSRRHKKLARQSTIDFGDIKYAIKAQETKQAGRNNVEKSEDTVSRESSRQSVAYLDLAELSHEHRRTAVCDELEKFTVVQEGKTLHSLRKDLLTLQRLKEWSFL